MLKMIYHTLRSANVARNAEWPGANRIDGSFRGNELAGETGEACNIIKKLERERLDIPGSRVSLDRLAEELADVMICVDLVGMHYGIDLRSAIARKFNATSAERGLDTALSEEFVL
jgi:NTP pyrophosphatase (non-canonical NTP hydrolase)